MKYDVFLSKNTKDYKEASKLLSFLENAGLNVFESQKSLPRLGLADYAKAIDDALEQSENLIVLCSPNELGTGEGIYSNWVYYEWTSFRNELLSKRKDGNLLTVLCDGVNIDMLPLGLRKYEAFSFSTIEGSKILEYFKKKNDGDTTTTISTFDKRSSVAEDLRLFDLGHHFSLCMFAKMQGKDNFQDLLQEDLDGFGKLPWTKSSEIVSVSIDKIAEEIEKIYGNTAADIFSLGQYCGISANIALFIVLGADDAMQQLQSVLIPFVKKANSLGIPGSTVNSLIAMIEEKNQERIINYHKIIRRAVAIRKETTVKCPYCGAITSIDNRKCPNCMSTLG